MYILSLARFAPGSRLFQYKVAAASGIVPRPSQVGRAKQPRDWETFTERLRTQAMTKPRGEGLSTPSL